MLCSRMLVPRGRRGAWFFCLLSSSRASGCDAEPQLQQGSGCQPKACVASLGASMCWCFVASVAKQSRRVRYQFRVCLCCQVSSWCTALEPFCLVCYECGSEYLAPPQGKVRRGTSEQSDIKVHSPGVLALCTQPLLPPGLAQVETALPGCGGPDPRGCPHHLKIFLQGWCRSQCFQCQSVCLLLFCHPPWWEQKALKQHR